MLIFIAGIAISSGIFAQSPFFWTETGTLSDPRYIHRAAASRGKIYVTGGNTNASPTMRNSLEIFDPATMTWSLGPSLAVARYQFGWAQVGDSGQLYAFGGEGPFGGRWAPEVEQYNPISNTWKRMRDWTSPRNDMAVGVIDGEIYLAGGRTGYGASQSTVQKYQPSNDTMITLASLQQHRLAAWGAVVADTFYVIGGHVRTSESVDEITQTVERYDPDADTWEYRAPLPYPFTIVRAVVKDNAIYVFGALEGSNYTTHVVRYDPGQDAWTTLATAESLWTSNDFAVLGDSIYSIGGYNWSTTAGYGTTLVSPFGVSSPDIVSVDSIECAASDSAALPVRINLASGRTANALEVQITYPADKLEFLSVDTTQSFVGLLGWSWEVNPTAGLLRIATAGASSMSGEGVIAKLNFRATGAPCQFLAVTIDSATIDTSSLDITLMNGGIQVNAVPFFGDVDLNGSIQAYDASVVLTAVVGGTTLSCQQTVNADVTLDGTISAVDATGILKRVVGSIPGFPFIPGEGGGELRLAAVKSGGMVHVEVSLASATNLYGVEGEVSFDPDVLAFSDSIWPSGYARTIDVSQGVIRWVAAATAAVEGPGAVVTFVFTPMGAIEGTVVRLKRTRLNENPRTTAIFEAPVTTTGAEDGIDVPLVFGLGQNYPNPFNPETKVPFTLAEEGRVSLRVYDVLGREVAVLVDDVRSVGAHVVTFDASRLPSGVYLLQLRSGAGEDIRKIVLQK